jgi:hypothetical protein
VAPKEVTTGAYLSRGAALCADPGVGLGLLWLFPGIVTILPKATDGATRERVGPQLCFALSASARIVLRWAGTPVIAKRLME